MSTTTMSAPADTATEPEGTGGGKKKLVLLVVLLLVGGAAGWWFFLRPPGEEPPPVPGEVLTMEPIQINLADGHYLRIGVALLMSADAAHPEGSKALDAVIDTFSGLEQSELIDAKHRKELKHELEEQLQHDYHGEVLEVYFTEFVTQ